MNDADKDVGQGPLKVMMVPPEKLRFNDWNPNRLGNEEYQGLLAEVRRTGQLPKPIVICADGDDYLVLDGEHGARQGSRPGWSSCLAS